jgi:hypothetical protein
VGFDARALGQKLLRAVFFEEKPSRLTSYDERDTLAGDSKSNYHAPLSLLPWRAGAWILQD